MAYHQRCVTGLWVAHHGLRDGVSSHYVECRQDYEYFAGYMKREVHVDLPDKPDGALSADDATIFDDGKFDVLWASQVVGAIESVSHGLEWSHGLECGKSFEVTGIATGIAVDKATVIATPAELVDLSSRKGFQREVLDAVMAIPRGEVRTYAELASSLGRPKAARAVGNAVAHNPIPLLVPCHRVVLSGGGVGGYVYGSPFKLRLLQNEGYQVNEGYSF